METVFIGNDEEGKPCYRLDRTDGTNENFHIQYYVGNTPIYGDYFQPRLEHELYKLYKTQIPLNDDELLVAYGPMEMRGLYPINRGMAELTVRAVERESIVGKHDQPGHTGVLSERGHSGSAVKSGHCGCA